ncbi:HlyD family efflux transporter periplasmic adaptor subunit [Telmatospirillum siberiense]|uniref:Peptidase M50 n=1 Tax=Telmatospirillum siberiense TaxID=382514 RepID=A0A2N3PZP6_9PROT|nr:HlyD family efflux transporter periplasmic adaptor subunit [Telmatospirillum siberiense]PKU25887.1 peptidase M50 [Telmatospirillum siberiense]
MLRAEPTLPPLREDLALHPGPVGADGAPSWTMHDPLRNQFFRLTWPAFEMLSRWHLADASTIARAVSSETTLEVTPEDIAEMATFLARSQLLKDHGPAQTGRLLAINRAHHLPWWSWLMHHYLFFRIPLVHPDRLLSRYLPRVAWLGGWSFRLSTLAALAIGLFLAGRQWDAFATTFVDRLSLPGLAAFGLTLTVAKVIHELGHAFTARNFGCRVPTMGVAFLVMWPFFYTDVNDAWTLPDRRRRLLVGGAGILAELTLAAWATLAWGLLPEGSPRAIAFTLAATTWISSLTINLSPFMRFDGYFLLMDTLDLPNLHGRAFALARWWLRERLFDLGEPPPERHSSGRQAFLIAFSFVVWIYRLVVFLGIAVLVYHFFIKAVGILLFGVEVGWFVLRPIVLELREWRRLGLRLVARRRGLISSGILAGLFLAAIIPWNNRVQAPAMLKASEHAAIYAPAPARVASIAVTDGQHVEAGQTLAQFDTPDLDYQLAQSERDIAIGRYQLASVDFDQQFRDHSPVIARRLETATARRTAFTADRDRRRLTAPFAGVVVDLSHEMAPGQWIGVKEPLLAIRSEKGALVEAYVAEEDLPRIAVGAGARFLPEGAFTSIAATVTAIDRTAVPTLADPALASTFGGRLGTRVAKQTLIPDEAVYRVRLTVFPPLAVPVSRRGEAFIEGERQSLLARSWRSLAAVLLREWGG